MKLNIRIFREKLGMTIAHLARESRLGYSIVQKMDSGVVLNVNIKKIDAIARVLKVLPKQLLSN